MQSCNSFFATKRVKSIFAQNLFFCLIVKNKKVNLNHIYGFSRIMRFKYEKKLQKKSIF